MKQRNIVIFGAGRYGRAAVKYYGKENIVAFVDNNNTKWGTYIYDIPVLNLSQLQENIKAADYRLIIAVRFPEEIERQLKAIGICNYELYSISNNKKYYPSRELVLNPYEEGAGIQNELEWNNESVNNPIKNQIRNIVETLYPATPIFDHIEIETINRFNGVCEFCPINTKIDPRKKKVMSKKLFEKIINELSELEYGGRIALYSNNEPMLDERIIDFYEYCRNKLPNAWLVMFTNGTLLTLDKFEKIIPFLDELVIDNYNEHLQLISNSKKIKDYCEENEKLKEKVTIVLRKPNEILTTRGGDAPNRMVKISHSDATCVLPFKQMIVRPDGKVSLCCNDPLGKNTLGDLTENSIMEVWNNDKFRMVRECLYKGRSNWNHCEFCDAFNLG